VARLDDRLLGTPQTAHEGTDGILRSQQVRDRRPTTLIHHRLCVSMVVVLRDTSLVPVVLAVAAVACAQSHTAVSLSSLAAPYTGPSART
jgi:hypothetical protein